MEVIILVIVISINLFLAFLVLKNKPKSATSIIFFLLSLNISLWLTANFLSLQNIFLDSSLFLIRLSMFFAMPLSALFFLFAHTLPRNRIVLRKPLFIFLVIITIVIMMLMLSPYGFVGVDVIGNSPNPIPGPGLIPFAFFSTLFSLAAVVTLIRKLRKETGIEKNQFKLIMFGILFMLGAIIFSIFVPVVFFHNNYLVPLLPLYTIIFLASAAYAIIRYKLLNIKFIIARSVFYFLLVFLVSAFFFVSTFYLGKYLSKRFQIEEIYTIIGTSTVVIIFLDPIKKALSKKTERILYKTKVDYDLILKELSEIINQEVELKILAEKYTNTLKDRGNFKNAKLWIPKESKVFINIQKKDEKVGQNSFKLGKALFNEVMRLKGPLTLAEFEYLQNDSTTKEEKKWFENIINDFYQIQATLFLPVFHEGNLTAILSIGERLSGDPFTEEDFDFYEVIAPQLGAAIEKARLYQDTQEFNKKLKKEILKATSELKSANEHLKELDTAKSEFISIASHQLRTPLTGIMGYLSMMVDGDFGKIDPAQLKILKDVYGASNRLIRIVNIFLNVSRIEAGRFYLDYKKISFESIVDEIIMELNPTATKKGIKLVVDPSVKQIGDVIVDPDKMKDVALNLVDNAIKYSQEGTITFSAKKENGNVHGFVRDQGVGIEPEEAKRLFSKFVRGTGIARVQPNGSGLGLFIAKKVVEEHGGKIWVESEGVGKGSTFQFIIPLKPTQNQIDLQAKIASRVSKQKAQNAKDLGTATGT